MKKSLEITLIIIITIITGIHLVGYAYKEPELDYFNTNTLINYSHGFVRRGLSGELVKWFSSILSINPLFIIKVFNLILVSLFLGYFGRSIFKYKLSFSFFLFPFVIPFLIIDDIINFKDFVTLILFIFLVKVAVSLKQNLFFKWFLLNVICMIAILNHEISFFIFIPSIVLIHYLINPNIGQIVIKTAFLIPILFILYLCIHYSGTVEQETQILSSYQYLPNNNMKIDQLSDKAIFLLPKFFTSIIWNGYSRGVTSLFYLIQIIFLLSFFDKIKTSFKSYKNTLNPHLLLFIYVILLVCFLPIFLIAYDWHRFLFLILISSLIIGIEFYKSERKLNITYILPNITLKTSAYLRNFFLYFIIPERSLLLLIGFFGIIPHMKMGNTPFQFSSLYLIIINFMTKITSILL